MSSFGIPNLPGYRQSRNLNPHGRRIPVRQKEVPRQPPTMNNFTGTQPVNGWENVNNGNNNNLNIETTGNGWDDVNYSPLNSPADMGWATQASPNNQYPESDASSYVDGKKRVMGKTVGPLTPKVHAAGERPHSFNEGKLSVCMHDALRFKCFFEEEVQNTPNSTTQGEHQIETKFIIRKFNLFFYLYDQSIAIQEMPTKNSGIEGTKFLSRSKVYKMNSEGRKVLFVPEDFKIKSKFIVNGQEFIVADADPRTRKWFMENRGEQLSPPVPFPRDDSEPPRLKLDEKTGILMDAEGRPVSPKNGGLGGFGKDDIRRKMAGKKMVRPDAEPKPIAPLLRDETVLRFYAIRAPSKEDGGGYFKGNEVMEAPFTFHYFVSDNTVEIAVIKKEDIGPMLLKRQILPKNSHEVPFNDHFTSKKGYSGELIHWKDLRCGATIDVYGRPILLLSADKQTTHWYAKRGITLKPWHDERFNPKETTISSRVPEYNGYGAPNIQDEFALGLALEPKESSGIVGRKGVIPDVPPKDKGVESCTGEGATLRFIAQRLDLKSGVPIDQEYDGKREFVICYYLEDDTIGIYEPEVRNSGVRGGLFLNRMKYKRHVRLPGVSDKNSSTSYTASPLSRWFKPADLSPGSDITIECASTGMAVHRFYVLECDSFTAAVLDEGGNPTAASAAAAAYLANEREASGISPRPAGVCGRLNLLLSRVSELLELQSVNTRRCFEPYSNNGLSVGLINEQDFKNVIKSGFRSAKGGNPVATHTILTEEDLHLFVYAFNAKPPSQNQGAIVDYGTFLDCMKLFHSDPPILAAHKEWNEKNAGHVALPPSLIKETKASYGFGRPQSVSAETSSTNTSIEESVLKFLKAKTAALKGHDEIEPLLLRKAFRALDIGERGLVSQHQLYKVIKNQGMQDVLTRSQADILMRKYAPSGQHNYRSENGARRISGSPVGDTMDYNALCDTIHNVEFEAVIDRILEISKEPKKPERTLHPVPTSLGPKPQNEVEASWNLCSSRTPENSEDDRSVKGDNISESQLSEAMQFFSAAFARPVRKQNLRKHCLAFDTTRRGSLSRKWLQTAIVTAVRECSIDVHRQDSTDILFDYFLPRPDDKVNYEHFLEVVFRRDFKKAKELRDKNVQSLHKPKHAWS